MYFHSNLLKALLKIEISVTNLENSNNSFCGRELSSKTQGHQHQEEQDRPKRRNWHSKIK